MKRIYHFIIVSIIIISSISTAQIDFIKHTIDGNYPGAAAVQAVDIDGDSLIDVICSGLAGNSITWWRNSGGNPIYWGKHTFANNFQTASSVYCTDIDGDEDNDIIGSAWMGDEIAWWRNDGGNPVQWTKQTIGQNFDGAESVFAIDIDDDKDVDVLGAAMNGDQIALWYSDGESTITWTKQIIDGGFGWARSVYAAYVNGDTLVDILGAAYTANTIAVWYNNGDSTWTKQIVDSTFGGAHRVFAYDLDKDNVTDILGAAYTGDEIAWWRNDGGNPIHWTKQTIGSNFDGAISVYTCDIDKDGDTDVIGTAEFSGVVALWLNEGGNPISWTRQTISNNFAGAWGIYAEDIDGDNDPDVLSGATVANDVVWWENDGIVNVENKSSAPRGYKLEQNYPNPFNPSTKIEYSIPEDSFVKLKIYDVLGNEIKILTNDKKPAGDYEHEFNATGLPGGIYFYQLRTKNFTSVNKMIYLK